MAEIGYRTARNERLIRQVPSIGWSPGLSGCPPWNR